PVGVLLSAALFASKARGGLTVESRLDPGARCRVYAVQGPAFFASSAALASELDFEEALQQLRLDLTPAHLWDMTAVEALARVVPKVRRNGIDVQAAGLSRATSTMVERYGTHHKPGAAAPAH